MIGDIFTLFISSCILLLPLVFWMYIFISFFSQGVSRKQFLLGLMIGAITTLPFVYRDGFFTGNILREVFFFLSVLDTSYFPINLLLSLGSFFLFFWGFLFILSYFFQKNRRIFINTHFRSVVFFSVLLVLGVKSITLLSTLFPESISGIYLLFGDLLFVSVGSIISYYVLISFLEEGTKYIAVLSFSGRGEYFRVLQNYICIAACIALGFAFFENILYTWNYIKVGGIDTSLISLVFFRSLFSVILHLISSMLFAFAFWYIFQLPKKVFQKITLFSLIGALALISHIFFDAALTFGYIGYIFFYIVGIYFFLSYLSVSSVGESPDILFEK